VVNLLLNTYLEYIVLFHGSGSQPIPDLMAWLGAQLKAQLKAAENLLEAVDRTVSTATGAIGTPPHGTDPGKASEIAVCIQVTTPLIVLLLCRAHFTTSGRCTRRNQATGESMKALNVAHVN